MRFIEVPSRFIAYFRCAALLVYYYRFVRITTRYFSSAIRDLGYQLYRNLGHEDSVWSIEKRNEPLRIHRDPRWPELSSYFPEIEKKKKVKVSRWKKIYIDTWTKKSRCHWFHKNFPWITEIARDVDFGERIEADGLERVSRDLASRERFTR